MQVGEHFLAAQNVFQALKAFVGQNSDFVRKILFELRNLRRLDRLSALVLFLPFPGEDLYIDDHALDTRRAVERSIAHVRSEEHTSELQSPDHLVCRLLLEKKKR